MRNNKYIEQHGLKALKEFKETVGNKIVKCAHIELKYDIDDNDDDVFRTIALKQNYNSEELELFLNQLDFKYDSGMGSQYLFGTIWLTDGSWFSRREYDGAEYWHHNVLPTIPDECK